MIFPTYVLVFSLKFIDFASTQTQKMQIFFTFLWDTEKKSNPLSCVRHTYSEQKDKESWPLTCRTNARALKDRDQNVGWKKTTTTHSSQLILMCSGEGLSLFFFQSVFRLFSGVRRWSWNTSDPLEMSGEKGFFLVVLAVKSRAMGNKSKTLAKGD